MLMTLLAQSDAETAMAVGVLVAIMLVALAIGLGIGILIAWLFYKPYKKLPAEYQQMSPGLVFLLLIPLFGVIWSFFIAIKLPASFKAYYDAYDDPSVGDAGKGLGLGWAICSACSIIPVVGTLAAIASLVLMILFIVKLWGMAKRIPDPEPVLESYQQPFVADDAPPQQPYQ